MQPLSIPVPHRSRSLLSAAVMVASGIVNIAIVAWVACPHRAQTAVSLGRILLISLVFVCFSGAAGMALTWGFWRIFRSDFLFGFRELALRAGPVWAFLPPIVFLIREGSFWASPLMLLAGIGAARCLRTLVPVLDRRIWLDQGSGAFALLPAPSHDIWLALTVAASLEWSALAIGDSQVSATGLLLAAVGFLVQWQILTLRPRPHKALDPPAWSRSAAAVAISVVLTLSILLVLRDHRTLALAFRGGAAKTQGTAKSTPKTAGHPVADAGYKGIILWTVDPKKNTVVLAPRAPTLVHSPERKPIVIPFDGPYWFFKPPHDNPGKNPHVTHGDPTQANIRSVDDLPLLMEAHESLASSVEVAQCRELQMHVRNADNNPGQIVLGVILSDTTLPGKPSLTLGGVPIPSTLPGRFAIKGTPVQDTLSYQIPERSRIRKFNQITVVFFPASERASLGVKVAIQDFVLFQR